MTEDADIVPEIRNQICGYLLVSQVEQPALETRECTNMNRPFCYPNILATCKSINKELTPMLYSNSEVNVSAEFRPFGRVTDGGCRNMKCEINTSGLPYRTGTNRNDPSLHHPILPLMGIVNFYLELNLTRLHHDEQNKWHESIVPRMKAFCNFLYSGNGTKQELRIILRLKIHRNTTANHFEHGILEVLRPFSEINFNKTFIHLKGCGETDVKFYGDIPEVAGEELCRTLSLAELWLAEQKSRDAQFMDEEERVEFDRHTKATEEYVLGKVSKKVMWVH
jgi:hypothetical protein